MKKTYNKPTAEKLAFKYRDQVVAASAAGQSSGGSIFTSSQYGNCYDTEDIGRYILEAIGICQYIG